MTEIKIDHQGNIFHPRSLDEGHMSLDEGDLILDRNGLTAFEVGLQFTPSPFANALVVGKPTELARTARSTISTFHGVRDNDMVPFVHEFSFPDTTGSGPIILTYTIRVPMKELRLLETKLDTVRSVQEVTRSRRIGGKVVEYIPGGDIGDLLRN